VTFAAAIWERAFRPFFGLAALYAVVSVGLWLLAYTGRAPAPAWLPGPWWHGHEMLFGFVAAAVAGFLLTAVPVWTGSRAVAGAPLAALVALWGAGRAALLLAGTLPAWAVALADLPFLLVVAALVARPVAAARQARNALFPAVVLVLALANGLVHAEALGWAVGAAPRGLRLGVDLVALLVVLVTGRIAPAFTANALRRDGADVQVRARPALERASQTGLALLALADLLALPAAATGALALATAAMAGARMAGWRSGHTRSDPLLWSLHLGAAWVPLGLACRAVAELTGALPFGTAIHALTAGAFGATVLAVMTRVPLGHTGRPLVVPRGIPLAYVLVNLGALLRVAGPAFRPDWTVALTVASGALWAAAFGWFAWSYAHILWGPRADGLPE